MDWTLSIDLRQNCGEIVVEFCLLNRDRQHLWPLCSPVRSDDLDTLADAARTFMDPREDAARRSEARKRFDFLASRSFDLESLLRLASVVTGDNLTISTLATRIPWDLIPIDGLPLAHFVNVGVNVPTPRELMPTGGAPAGAVCFLHVVANPGDLEYADMETNDVRELVAGVSNLEYCLLANPPRRKLLDAFSGKRIGFFHFTGHVLPGQGLKMSDGDIFSIRDITKYFPGEGPQGRQLVFVNGCDQAPDAHGVADAFRSASTANAFLHGGARAVVAPRSEVFDAPAAQAAKQIWSEILAGASLGSVVRKFRVARDNAGESAGTSYVLYGDPAGAVREFRLPGDSPQQPAISLTALSIVREARRLASGPIAPRHLFAALSQGWAIGQIYFGQLGQGYVEALQTLRLALGVSAAGGSAALEFTKAGELVLQRATDRFDVNRHEELAYLEALGDIDDPEIRVGLQSLREGPRSVLDIVADVRRWQADGQRMPPALFQPSGDANPTWPLQALLPVGTGEGQTSRLDAWDFLMLIVRADGHLAARWREARMPPPLGGAPWNPGERLSWSRFEEDLRQVWKHVFHRMEIVRMDTLSEAFLVEALLDVLESRPLPHQEQRSLQSHGIDWERFCKLTKMALLRW